MDEDNYDDEDGDDCDDCRRMRGRMRMTTRMMAFGGIARMLDSAGGRLSTWRRGGCSGGIERGATTTTAKKTTGGQSNCEISVSQPSSSSWWHRGAD